VACAAELARRGAQVVILERDRVGEGCSFGNAGWLTPSLAAPLANPGMVFKSLRWMLDPESPLYIQPNLNPSYLRWLAEFLLASRRGPFERGLGAMLELCKLSVDLWEDLATRSPRCFGFARKGLLAIYESEAALANAEASGDFPGRHGIRFESWSPEEVREREPAVIGAQAGGHFFPDDAHCQPHDAVLAMAEEARTFGAQILEGVEVYDIEGGPLGPRILRTTRGNIVAERIVLAAGAWSDSLGKLLGIRIPVIGAKGYSVLLPRREPHPSRPLYLIERKVALTPHRDCLRLAGTLELVRGDASINRRRVEAILRGARAMLNLGEPEPLRVWRGLRPCVPDGMPLIGRSRASGEVWLATGHQMTGLKTAPGTARLLAELMLGEAPSFDPGPFRADRY
jgi:D-amino-acid dehydrogenase